MHAAKRVSELVPSPNTKTSMWIQKHRCNDKKLCACELVAQEHTERLQLIPARNSIRSESQIQWSEDGTNSPDSRKHRWSAWAKTPPFGSGRWVGPPKKNEMTTHIYMSHLYTATCNVTKKDNVCSRIKLLILRMLACANVSGPNMCESCACC